VPGAVVPLLLQHHWKKGRDFIVDLLNYSAEWYGKRLGLTEASTSIRDRDVRGQNDEDDGRMASLDYIGHRSHLPAAINSDGAQAFLFEVAKQDENLLDPVLLQLLRASTTGAVTAVVASLAVAHPRACGETLLGLLSSPECIRLDRARMASDRMGSPYPRLPQHDVLNEIFAKERTEADAQQHRQQDLETAITLLQASPYGARVCEAIDKHRAAIPPIEDQTEEDRLWRLALHRMDLRNYEPVPAEETPAIKESVPANYVLLTPGTPETDLQEMVEESSNRHARVSERIGNQMWGIKVFEREDGNYDPAEWRSRLAAVRAGEAASDAPVDEMFFGDGAAVTAAVCVRDHCGECCSADRHAHRCRRSSGRACSPRRGIAHRIVVHSGSAGQSRTSG
jgi:hypothetical protein